MRSPGAHDPQLGVVLAQPRLRGRRVGLDDEDRVARADLRLRIAAERARQAVAHVAPSSTSGSAECSDTLLAPVGAGSRYTATPALSGPRSLIWPSIAPRCSPRRSSTPVDLLNSPTIPHIPWLSPCSRLADSPPPGGHGPASNKGSQQGKTMWRFHTSPSRARRATPAHATMSANHSSSPIPHASAWTTAHRRMRSRSRSRASLRRSTRRRTRRAGCGIGGELRTAVAQQRGDVERALADERLRVDRQPGPARGAQDVAAVEVLMEEDRVAALRAGREQLADPADGAVEQPAVERAPVAVPAHGQLVRPAPRLARERAERVAGRRRLRGPEAAEHGGGLQVGLRLVRDAPQPVARRAALDEQRAAPGIRREQPDRAGAVPVRQRRRLVLALGLGEVDLQHRRAPVGAGNGRDEGERARGITARRPRAPTAPRTRPRAAAPARATLRPPRSQAGPRVHAEPALRGGDRAQRLAQPGAPQRRQRARVDAVVGRAPLGEARGVMLEADPRDRLERLAQRGRRLGVELPDLLARRPAGRASPRS